MVPFEKGRRGDSLVIGDDLVLVYLLFETVLGKPCNIGNDTLF